jgi:hypothetical protein
MIRVRVSHRPVGRILCFDLENMGGAYWYGDALTKVMTAIGWKWADERKVHTLLKTSSGEWVDDDGIEMAREDAFTIFADVLESAGLVYGHNIRRHDLPMFNAHLLRCGMRTLHPLLTTDTLRDLPSRGGMAASLDNLVSMYGISGKKFKLSQHDWEVANELGEAGLALTRKRVSSDVRLQERLRKQLLEVGALKPARRWVP